MIAIVGARERETFPRHRRVPNDRPPANVNKWSPVARWQKTRTSARDIAHDTAPNNPFAIPTPFLRIVDVPRDVSSVVEIHERWTPRFAFQNDANDDE